MILVVTYELKQPPESYGPLFEALKGENSWAHYMASTWLISAEESAKEFTQKLLPLIFEGDRLLVTALAPEYGGWLPHKAWEWIKRYRED
jgi:hypothetical protein